MLREFTTWQETYEFVGGTYQPVAQGETFTNAYRYGNWTIIVRLLLTQLPIAFALARPDLHRRAFRMAIPALLMIWTGLYGQFGETGDWSPSEHLERHRDSLLRLADHRGARVINAGIANSPAELKAWPKNIWWFFLATWGLYPIAYALPQLGFTGDVVVVRQLLFSIADTSSKLIYGVILSRYVLRRSALEGYLPSAEALSTKPAGSTAASIRGD